jgi:hypothetical protein
MHRIAQLLSFCVLGASLLLAGGCASPAAEKEKSYAIYAEFAKANVPMKAGLNRRVFNTTEAQRGTDIRRETDGSITLQPGTYRITGFSTVTMQTTFAPPVPKFNLNYPGYCLVYPAAFETNDPLGHQVGIGSPGTALDGSPSEFDLIYTCTAPTQLCVGHQSGEELNNEVYLGIYDVAGAVSPYHVFARIAIVRL